MIILNKLRHVFDSKFQIKNKKIKNNVIQTLKLRRLFAFGHLERIPKKSWMS